VIGAVLAGAWFVSSFFSYELRINFLFIVLLAVQTVVLYVFLRAQPVAWSSLAEFVATVLAIPASIAEMDPELLLSRYVWTVEVPNGVWELKWYIAAFLIVPVLLSHSVQYLRFCYRLGRAGGG